MKNLLRSTHGGFLIALTLGACGSNDALEPGAADATPATMIDAAPQPTADAYIDDVPTQDAGVDAAPVPLGRVTVIARDSGGALVAGDTVLFLDAHDALVAEVTTDAAGEASATISADAHIVRLLPARGGHPATVQAFLGAQPGETITLGHVAYVAPGPNRNLHVTVPALAGANRYQVQATCGGRGTYSGPTASTTVIFGSPCTPTVDLLALAFHDDTLLGTFTIDDATATSTMAITGTYLPPTTMTATVAHLPSDLGEHHMEIYAMSPEADVLVGLAEGDLAVDGGHGTFAGAVPDIATGAVLLRATIGKTLAADGSQLVYVGRPRAATHGLDLATLLVPWTTLPTLAPGNQQVQWTDDATGAIDGVALELTFQRASGAVHWSVFASAPGTAVTLPTLPAAYASFAPTAADMARCDLADWYRGDAASLAQLRAIPFDDIIRIFPAPGGFFTSRHGVAAP